MYVSREFPIYYQNEDTLQSINEVLNTTQKTIDELKTKWLLDKKNIALKTELNAAEHKRMELESLLTKHLEQDPAKKLKAIWKDINSSLDNYKKKCSQRYFQPAQERISSIQRLLNFGGKIFHNSNTDASIRLHDLLGLLLYELTVTENHHNGNWYSRYYTVSSLAENYMRVFQNNGIDLTLPEVNKVYQALAQSNPETYFKSYKEDSQPTEQFSTKHVIVRTNKTRKHLRNAIIKSPVGSFEENSNEIEDTKKQISSASFEALREKFEVSDQAGTSSNFKPNS